MKKEEELRKEATAEVKAAKALQELAETEDRDLTEEESGKIEAHLQTADKLLEKADRLRDISRREARLKEPQPRASVIDDLAPPGEGDTNDPAKHLGAPPAEPRNVEEENRHGFRSLGEQALAIRTAMTPGGAVDNRLNYFSVVSDKTAHQQQVGADGGFLVAPTFSNQIWDGVREASDSLVGRTEEFTVTGESLELPAVNETSRADGSRWGGIQGFWKAERTQMTESAAAFRTIRLEPQQLYVFAYVTDKLLQNAPALEGFLRRAATDEINFKVGDAIWNGTGAGQPRGVQNSAALITITPASGPPDTVTWTMISDMWARFLASRRSSSAWFINQDVEPQLLRMSFDSGATNPQVPIYMPQNNVSGSPFATILGRPVIPIEYAATLGDAGDITLADMSAYWTGTKGGVDSAMSIHLRFDYNETAFRFIFEIDGKSPLNSAITPKNGTNTLSPFVRLAARA